ncbi:mitochondrial ribonuclease P catalytic subunit [Diprion similis]|uniref:mitochondrial ribonuclease P catalytic subunit n=1 Tax=Diprion similis TaxID=362088 RepID=UPI001EF7C4B2|nr:mitochondrial ribonuclease P catalytic subunit [Diprion similis]
MFPSFIHSKKLIRYKNNLFKKWAMYWKNLYTDYANVGITTYQDCVANPLRFSLTLTTAWGVYYIKSHNPDELSYRSAIINANNYFTLISSTARNPSTTEYLTIINKSLSQGLARYFSCGLFSIVWIDEFDDIVSGYKQQCRYLKISWIALPDIIMAFNKISMGQITALSRLCYNLARQTRDSGISKFEKLSVLQTIKGQSSLSSDQWKNLRNEIMATDTSNVANNVNTTMLQYCLHTNNVDLGTSCMKYLRENDFELHPALVGVYFKLLWQNPNTFTEDHRKQDILSIYNDLRVKYPLLDASTAEHCLKVISHTEKWRDVIELLEIIKISCKPCGHAYNSAVCAAFKNGDGELAWKLLHEMAMLERVPSSDAYIACLNYCLQNFEKPQHRFQEIEKLFDFLAQYWLKPHADVVNEIAIIFTKLGWVVNTGIVDLSGRCSTCTYKLSPPSITHQEFSQLSQVVLEKTLIGQDAYNKSTPAEIQKLIYFVNKTKPYDIVIDGLNVAYQNNSNEAGAQNLASLVRFCLDRNQTVLVFGRKHMLKWNRNYINYIKNNAFLFLTDDLSFDDPFLLYSTLVSGPHTKFVSSDLMRQHKFLMRDPILKTVFKLWQMSHQCFAKYNKRGRLTFINPLKFSPIAQKGMHCWHIPYGDEADSIKESFEPPSKWLCLANRKHFCK